MSSATAEPLIAYEPIPPKSLVVKTNKPRPHICPVCTRGFARLEHLRRHERSHTKEKPYECPVCERKFARRDLLLRHKQKLHAVFTEQSKKENDKAHSPESRSKYSHGRNHVEPAHPVQPIGSRSAPNARIVNVEMNNVQPYEQLQPVAPSPPMQMHLSSPELQSPQLHPNQLQPMHSPVIYPQQSTQPMHPQQLPIGQPQLQQQQQQQQQSPPQQQPEYTAPLEIPYQRFPTEASPVQIASSVPALNDIIPLTMEDIEQSQLPSFEGLGDLGDLNLDWGRDLWPATDLRRMSLKNSRSNSFSSFNAKPVPAPAPVQNMVHSTQPFTNVQTSQPNDPVDFNQYSASISSTPSLSSASLVTAESDASSVESLPLPSHLDFESVLRNLNVNEFTDFLPVNDTNPNSKPNNYVAQDPYPNDSWNIGSFVNGTFDAGQFDSIIAPVKAEDTDYLLNLFDTEVEPTHNNSKFPYTQAC